MTDSRALRMKLLAQGTAAFVRSVVEGPPKTERDVVQMIRERVKEHGDNRAAAAASLGVSRQYLQMILARRRVALRNPKLLKALKLRREVIFLPC